MEKEPERTFCPTNPPFPEVFLRFFANDGLLSYRTKCLSVGIIFYLLGAFAAYISGMLYYYFIDYGHFLVSVVAGVSFYLIINVCKQINPTIAELDNVMHHSDEEKFEGFVQRWTYDFPYWYYLCLTTGITVALVQNLFPELWTVWPEWFSRGLQEPLIRLYSLLWGICVNSLIAVSFNRMTYYTFFVNAYCRDYIRNAKLDFLVTDVSTDLKGLGKLAVKACLAVALPILIEGVNFFKYLSKYGKISNWHCFGLVAYVGVLVFTLLFPLRHAHKAMVNGKKEAVSNVNKEIRRTQGEISADSKGFLKMHNLLRVRERAKAISTWPLDFVLYSKFAAAVMFPIVAGAILQIAFEHILSVLA